jgi:hypothetical protein
VGRAAHLGIRWVEELVEVAGGEPIFPELRDAKLGKDRIVEPDEVVAPRADAIVASWCGKAVRPERIPLRPDGTACPLSPWATSTRSSRRSSCNPDRLRDRRPSTAARRRRRRVRCTR